MGANNGTGQPNFFRCSKCRVNGSWGEGMASRVELTGRKRPVPSKEKGGGVRNTHIRREYRCGDCGHVGWSRHIELAYKAGDHLDLHILPDGTEYLPSYARSDV